MIKQEIIEKISKYFNLTQYEAIKIYEDIFSGIIQGVKDDNIADISNLGEFIIKFENGGTDGKKNVEFLPSLFLEEEINQRSFEEQRTFEPAPYVNPLEAYSEGTKKETGTNIPPISQEVPDIYDTTEDVAMKQPVSHRSLAEEEIKRKRDEILRQITTQVVEKQTAPLEKENIIVPPVIVPPVNVPPIYSENMKVFEENTTVEQAAKLEEEPEETVLSSADKIDQEISSEAKDPSIEEKNEVNKMSESSFSDFFSELNESPKNAGIRLEKDELPSIESVIPMSAVELHNELTGEKSKSGLYQSSLTQPPVLNGNGSGNSTEHKLKNNSYYIWYKDSDPNVADTQTLSYEYELLYQATKEVEYKSKLRIYVTTFIMFFSVVLILLIFSPVIYKYFFTPKETDQKTEYLKEESAINQGDPNTNAADNVTSGTQQNNAGFTGPNTPPVTGAESSNTPPVAEVPKQEAPKQELNKNETSNKDQTNKEPVTKQKTTSPSNENSVLPQGVTKNSIGWLDDVNKVIYIQLENGKFTIQESAWDSEAKANKRISVVESFMSGLKGTIVPADMGAKGTWYRSRFGEFNTIDEARIKAAELRSREKTRLHALILSILLYA